MPYDPESTPNSRPWRLPPLLRASLALHVGALVAGRLFPGQRRRLLAALALDHLALCAAVVWPRGRLLGPNVRRLDEIESKDGAGPVDRTNEIALTFDDGPDPEITPRVLDLLDAHDARASFFVLGRRAAAHPELTREIARRGHRVENHTYDHPHAFGLYGPRAQASEIDRAQETIADLVGRRPIWFRAPAGIRNLFLEPILARRGLHLASWTRRGYDTVEHRPERVARRLVRDLAPGDLLLLHDGSAAGRPPRDSRGRPVVLEALPRVLDAASARGCRVVSLPEPPQIGGWEMDPWDRSSSGDRA